MTLKELIDEAVKYYLKNKSYLPIKFLNIFNPSTNTFKVWFIDTDIEYTFSKVFPNNTMSHKAEFYAVISEDFLDPGTLLCDSLAIPSDITGDKRIILRIAWAIHTAYRNHILTAYKLIEKDPKKLTWANAKKWYDTIRCY